MEPADKRREQLEAIQQRWLGKDLVRYHPDTQPLALEAWERDEIHPMNMDTPLEFSTLTKEGQREHVCTTKFQWQAEDIRLIMNLFLWGDLVLVNDVQKKVNELYTGLADKQESLGAAFADAIYENLEELYDES